MRRNFPANVYGDLLHREYYVYGNSNTTDDVNVDMNDVKAMIEYAQMAKKFMNKPFDNPLDIVGNYEWHQNFPYVDCLTRGITLPPKPFICDFGCGPGRMVDQFKSRAYVMDGIDISGFALDYLRKKYPDDSYSSFYESSGIDVGEAVSDSYDLVYSTIAIQHIPSRKIRMNIFRGIHNILVPGGWMSVQMAFNPTYNAGVWSHDTEHAKYDSDFWNAKGTNGHADVVINSGDLDMLKADLSTIFDPESIIFDFENVSNKYQNLGGAYHAPYWASDWLFIKAQKRKI